ncbi:hypothetical protein KL933_003935 [Ogataea haglerorum]|uniref:Uncharacterized protein n=2 Tax=Ogataea haglerorum TaxID=1937702 RepID=A0AAN6D361_9ASCO|nr:hypothetical protein KL914_002944 [Ogataea haglerorum]KAG7725887.1 hypothetical protein KL933_003935 [Ogataea haglerorum]KAG7731922.1 hypothetical protein KL948_002855 [Ogataea haglerorum]KAG7734364.1 hypothetical protein KL932_004818 [Ogataea haglerorum]KAG7748172.1 hypothetical protein KL912_002849 [Ogataea haglerorum]
MRLRMLRSPRLRFLMLGSVLAVLLITFGTVDQTHRFKTSFRELTKHLEAYNGSQVSLDQPWQAPVPEAAREPAQEQGQQDSGDEPQEAAALEESEQPSESSAESTAPPPSESLQEIPQNPLEGTNLDNPQKRNPDRAPLPPGYRGSMTHEYKPYEQVRVVKDKFGNPAKQNATMLTLVRNEELYDMLQSIQQLESRFNRDYQYDWVFLNDKPFTDEFIQHTSAMVSGTARYGIIPYEHWSYPEYIDPQKAKEIRESRQYANVAYGSSESYRHMCRFNSLFFYKHPIMDDYQYYWRVEPSIEYGCDILTDPFKYMVENNVNYGFTLTLTEFPKTIPTLWKTSLDYFLRPEVAEQLPSDEENLLSFISGDSGRTYNLCHFWSNFEIANLDFYRNPVYEGYVQHLDRAGGFFYERWGDAPVHTIAVAKMMRASEIHLFTEISYKHTVAGSCPLDDAFRRQARCTCDPGLDWSITSGSSCNLHYMEVAHQPHMADYEKYRNVVAERQEQEQQRKKEEVERRREAAKQRAEERRQRAEERRRRKQKEREERLRAAKTPAAN